MANQQQREFTTLTFSTGASNRSFFLDHDEHDRLSRAFAERMKGKGEAVIALKYFGLQSSAEQRSVQVSLDRVICIDP